MAQLLDLTLKTSLLLGAAALVTGRMRRASAASRHAVWMGLFAALTLLPIASLTLPALPLAVWAPAPSLLSGDRAERPQRAMNQPSVTALSAGPLAPVFGDRGAVRAAAPAQRVNWTLSGFGGALWVLGVGLCLLRAGAGMIGVRRLGRRAQLATDPALLKQLNQVRQALQVRRPIRLLTVEAEIMPITWGVRRPTILLPAAVGGWVDSHPERLDAVLVHEVAHIARFDALAQLLTQVPSAVWWFHPFVWLAKRQARLERERACDDLALIHGSRPSDYARELLMLIQLLRPLRSAFVSTLAMARRPQLDRRIRAILDARVNRQERSPLSLLVAAALIATMVPVAAVRLTVRTAVVATSLNHTVPSPVRSPDPGASRLRVVATGPAIRLALQPRVARPREAAAPGSIGRVGTGPVEPIQPAAMDTVAEGAEVHQTSQANQTLTDRWRDERAAMFKQLITVAQTLVDGAYRQIQIGTMLPIDTVRAERTLNQLRLDAAVDREESQAAAAPSEAAMALTREHFAAALHNLDVDQTKFSVGLMGVFAFTADLIDAEAVLRASDIVRSGGVEMPLSDAEITKTLQRASVEPDHDRASALIALAIRTALTPAMVTLYVNTAMSITSEEERARIFAQPIRLKPPGGS